MKKLLVVVDMQNDFVCGVLGTEQARAVADRVAKRVRAAFANGESVVFTRDTHHENYLSTAEGQKLPVAHCLQKSHGWEIIDELDTAGAKIIDKCTFGSTELGEYVRENAFDAVELIGVCTDMCVISNAILIKAFAPETDVCVRENCCAGVTVESHRTALQAMAACQIEIL